MKYIFLLIVVISQLLAGVVKSPLLSVDEENDTATISIENIDVGMSGFIVHGLLDGHSSILKNIVVIAHNKESKIATLQMSSFDGLKNNSLPEGKWHVEVNDTAVLAFGYSRALLLAPDEEIYHRITKSVNIQWIHPDIFATILSFNGHPTPLKKDFDAMSTYTSVGLIYIYLNQKLFTLDAKSFKILNISDAPLVQEKVQLPFYSRVEKIDAAWWGVGSKELTAYEPYYYQLLLSYNKNNKELQEKVKSILLEKKKLLTQNKQAQIREGITHATSTRFRKF